MLHPDARHSTMLDGGWWPRSTNLAQELPPLVTELERRGTHIIRATYHPATWDSVPRKLPVGGRLVHVGWFREIDRHLISLTGGNQERVELLVVPPGTDHTTAERAMMLAGRPDNHASPSEVLALSADQVRAERVTARAAGPDVARPSAQQERRVTDAWESEGGSTAR